MLKNGLTHARSLTNDGSNDDGNILNAIAPKPSKEFEPELTQILIIVRTRSL